MQATHAYVGEDMDELTFEPGDIITVVPYDNPEDQVSRHFQWDLLNAVISQNLHQLHNICVF